MKQKVKNTKGKGQRCGGLNKIKLCYDWIPSRREDSMEVIVEENG